MLKRALSLVSALLLITSLGWGMSIIPQVTTATTTGSTNYTSGSFSPTDGDLLVVLVVASDTVATGSVSDTQGLGFTKIGSALYHPNGITNNTIYAFVANALASNVSTNVSFDCSGDAATGSVIVVYSARSMSRVGLTAIRQFKVNEEQSAGTPEVVFNVSPDSSNGIIAAVGNATNPATLTPPAGLVESVDSGYGTPTTGMEVAAKTSSASQTLTWGSSSASEYAALALEFDSSVLSTPSNLRVILPN